MSSFFQIFVRLTGWLPQWFCFRTKISYEDKRVQSRRIKGGAIIVSNHTSVYDYAVLLFVFFTRTLRYQMAEVLFRPGLGTFLKMMGGIYIDRKAHQYGFMDQSLGILRSGGVVGVFPEGRLPVEGETPPIAFRPGAAYLSLISGAPVIPVWTNGSYFNRKRARVMIGTPLFPDEYRIPGLSEKEMIERYASAMREKIIRLRELSQNESRA